MTQLIFLLEKFADNWKPGNTDILKFFLEM